MNVNFFAEKMVSKSDADLKYYLENKEQFQEEAVLAAHLELANRGLIEFKPKSEPKEEVLVAEVVGEEDTELVSEEYKEVYPPKPHEEVEQQSMNRSLISVGLFIAAFYFIFRWDLTYILVLTGVIFIHEMGHYLAMRMYKYKDLGIFFVPLIGAFASGNKEKISQKQEIIILLAGPLPGVIIGIILYYFGLKNESQFLIRTSNIFILLNLFNLIPVMPLDGGKVIKAMFFENKEVINKVFIFLSIAVLAFIALYTHSYFLLLIPIFLFSQLGVQTDIKKVRTALIDKGININKTLEELTDREYWLIRDEMGIHMKYFTRFITPKRYVVDDNEQKIIKQVKDIVQNHPKKDLGVFGKILITMLWIFSFIVPLVAIVIFHLVLGVKIG